jgi:hypothetical protein
MKLAISVTAVGALLLAGAGPADATTWGTRHLDDRNNHGTVSVHVGQTVELTLASTYWTIGRPSGTALGALGAERKTPNYTRPGCHGGSGCGTDVRDFRAVRTGTSGISATRTTCGEALRCTDAQSRFFVTVNVTP